MENLIHAASKSAEAEDVLCIEDLSQQSSKKGSSTMNSSPCPLCSSFLSPTKRHTKERMSDVRGLENHLVSRKVSIKKAEGGKRSLY